MKMPKPWHLPFPGQLPQRDRFGIRYNWSLLESETDRLERVAAVEKLVADVFGAARLHLGEDEARSLFRRVSRRRKRGKGKAHTRDRDTRLLSERDAATRAGETVASLARRLHCESKGQYGSTEGAIQRQIHKLVKERKMRERAAAVQARRWRMASRYLPPTLLGSARNEK